MGRLIGYLRRLKRKFVGKKPALKCKELDCLQDPAPSLWAIPDACPRDQPYHYVGAVERLFKDARHTPTYDDPLGKIEHDFLAKLFTELKLGDEITSRLHPDNRALEEVPLQDCQPGVEMSKTRRMSLDQERLAHLLF